MLARKHIVWDPIVILRLSECLIALRTSFGNPANLALCVVVFPGGMVLNNEKLGSLAHSVSHSLSY